jgi:hypothetical protein
MHVPLAYVDVARNLCRAAPIIRGMKRLLLTVALLVSAGMTISGCCPTGQLICIM